MLGKNNLYKQSQLKTMTFHVLFKETPTISKVHVFSPFNYFHSG